MLLCYLLCITLPRNSARWGRVRHANDTLLGVQEYGQILFKPRLLQLTLRKKIVRQKSKSVVVKSSTYCRQRRQDGFGGSVSTVRLETNRIQAIRL